MRILDLHGDGKSQWRVVSGHATDDDDVRAAAAHAAATGSVGCSYNGAEVERVLDTAAVPVDPDMARKVRRAASRFDAAREERDRLIVAAVDAGGGAREVARLAGVSHPTVLAIVRKAHAGDE